MSAACLSTRVLLMCALAAARNNIQYKLYTTTSDCTGAYGSFSWDTYDYCVTSWTTWTSAYLECNNDNQVVSTPYDLPGCEGAKGDSKTADTGECFRLGNTSAFASYSATCSNVDDPCFGRDSTFACRVVEPGLSAEAAFDACFSSSPVASQAERVPMASLSAGDIVLSAATDGQPVKTSVIVNQHKAELKTSTLLHLHHTHGSLSLTADHVLHLNGRFAAAREAKEGDHLTATGFAPLEIERITSSRGAVVNPITADGRVL